MELHQHFINIGDLELSIFELMGNSSSPQDSIDCIISDFIVGCFDKLKILDNRRRYLELLRLLLCQQYKMNYEGVKDNRTRFYTKSYQFTQFLVKSKVHMDKNYQSILDDIMILLLLLFENHKNFICIFEDFRASSTTEIQSVNKFSDGWYLRVLKCILNAWEVLYFLNDSRNMENFKVANRIHLESCRKVLVSSVLYDLQSWIKCREHNEWLSLYSVLSKLVSVAKSTNILSPYVYQILNENFGLSTICVLSDFVFPVDTLSIDVDYSMIHNSKLWSNIQSKLISEDSASRKQALYLFKRLVNFISTNEIDIREAVSLNVLQHGFNPFICDRTGSNKLDIRQIEDNFILIMEALEEKQKHLVTPTLSLIDSLITGYEEHKSCGYCFDFSWIFSIFSRIMNHNNHAIVKWGLLKALQLNTKTFEHHSLLALIVRTLNNTFLYEKYGDESEPEIVTALTNCINNTQSENLPSMKKFLICLYPESWGPVPIFYILQSLLSVSTELENTINWQQDQLDVVASLVKAAIQFHPPMIRSMSQIMSIKVISRFSKVQDLMILSKTLSAFSEKDLKDPRCWSALRSWLGKITYDDVTNFIRQVCKSIAIENVEINFSMSVFALIIQLLYEEGVICQTEDCIEARELRFLCLSLDKIDVRPYIIVSQVVKTIDFIYSLFDLKRQVPKFIYNIFMGYKETIFNFLPKLFYNNYFNYEEYKVVARALQIVECCVDGEVNTISILASTRIKELELDCIKVFSGTNQLNNVQLLFALDCWSNIPSFSKYEDNYFLGKIDYLLRLAKERSGEFKGKLGLDYYVALSKLIRNYMLTLGPKELKKNNWLKIISSILDAAGNEILIYFLDVVRFYATAVFNDTGKLGNLKDLLKNFWRCNFGSKRNTTFWTVAQKLTECINSSDIIGCSSLREASKEFTDCMLTEGDSLPGLKYILLVCSDTSKHFNYFMETILNGLLHGQVMRRDQRITVQAHIAGRELISGYELTNGSSEHFDAHEFLNRQPNVDAAVRAAAVIKLCEALEAHQENSAFLLLVLKKLMTAQNKRYYANSQLHKLKHRIMQVLLILQPHLNKNSTKILYYTLRDSIIKHTDQPSVRMMREWLLVRIYFANEDLRTDIWSFFEKVCEERPNSASSIIGIIWLLAQHLTKDKLDKFLETALEKLGCCCMAQQFNMRLFGQVFFTKLYELLDENSHIRSQYASFYKATQKSLRSGHFKNNPVKINEDFFYNIFYPIEHYSLETIYHQLPRLTNVDFDEWIEKETFKDQILLGNPIINIRIGNLDNLLDTAVIPASISKTYQTRAEEIEFSDTTADIQKKMTPWNTMFPNEEGLSQLLDSKDLKKINKQNLIVVATLIDKSQNLGGIARTCEIFGVKELVISDLKQTVNKDFQVLSVSADKWIKIIEVKPFSLKKYLLELKDCGWKLIGAEQTAKSVNLNHFKFPKQTVLVLGNEKSGISPDIIPLLDICLEIPQFGVIRSLNVHVTSAICIWEYTKQHQYATE